MIFYILKRYLNVLSLIEISVKKLEFKCVFVFLANPWRDQNDEHQGYRAVGPGHEIVSRRSVVARQVDPEVVQPEEGGRHHEPVWT